MATDSKTYFWLQTPTATTTIPQNLRIRKVSVSTLKIGLVWNAANN